VGSTTRQDPDAAWVQGRREGANTWGLADREGEGKEGTAMVGRLG
jgi:hypothetical protein